MINHSTSHKAPGNGVVGWCRSKIAISQFLLLLVTFTIIFIYTYAELKSLKLIDECVFLSFFSILEENQYLSQIIESKNKC